MTNQERVYSGVVFPKEKELEFQRFVKGIGGEILTQGENFEKRWLEEYTQLQAQINRIKENILDPQIGDAFKRLNEALTSFAWRVAPYRNPEDFSHYVEISLSSDFPSIILKALDEELNEYHKRYKKNPYVRAKGGGLRYHWFRANISPRQIRVLIAYFGLDGSEPKNEKEVAQQEGVKMLDVDWAIDGLGGYFLSE